MKKLLKILGIILLSAISIIVIALLVLKMSDIPSYEVEKIEYQAISTPESIERVLNCVSHLSKTFLS